jgi:uncharacterized protein YcbX
MAELRLSEIWIYPIKSLGGISLQQAQVMEKGLKYDRRWMLIDEAGNFMTQRKLPELALFKVQLEATSLRVQFRNESIYIPLEVADQPLRQVTIWDDKVLAYEVRAEISAWFSRCLKTDCRLVFFPEQQSRPVDARYKIADEQVSLADAYPFLIIGHEALALLNSKLEQPLPMNRFRPNFIFTGGVAHEEDTWRDFTIGANRFVGVKPCARCVLTTVNQETADTGKEPLRTLATYRSRDNKILFGQNLLAVDHNRVRVGDVITIQSKA